MKQTEVVFDSPKSKGLGSVLFCSFLPKLYDQAEDAIQA